MTLSGNASGEMIVTEKNGAVAAKIAVSPSKEEKTFYGKYTGKGGVQPLFFTFRGKGTIQKFTKIVLE